jgi:phage gp37-like protein
MRAQEFIPERKKKKSSRSMGGYFFPGYAYYGGGESGEGGGDGGGESINRGVAEGKLVESAVFLNPTTVVVGQAHGQPLELSPNTLKQIQAIAAKHGAWYEGNGTDRGYTKGQIDRYVGSWDDEVAKTADSNDPKWIYVLFANVNENNRVQRVGVDPRDTIFNRLLDTAKDNSYQGIGYTSQALQKFLQMASEGKYDFVKMSQQPATQENLTRFLKAGEALMWPSNWKQYPNKAGKIAKAATVDVRDQYLATRKAGVYVAGFGHLKAVQNITGKQGVAEDN